MRLCLTGLGFVCWILDDLRYFGEMFRELRVSGSW